ncbi:MAG: DinB family protein [Candidatus Kapaibacteriota bacterium]
MKIQQLIQELDFFTQEVQSAFGTLTHEELNRKSNPDTWSIAQNLDHLMVINETYFPIFDALKNGTYSPPFLGKFTFITSFFGNLIYKMSAPEHTKPIKTMSISEPSNSEIHDVIQAFVGHQEQLKQHISELEGCIASGSVIASPANPMIVYTLEQALNIIVVHEKRHILQAKNIRI